MDNLKNEFVKNASDELFLCRNVPMLSRFFSIIGVINKQKLRIAKENPELTQIYLPYNKIDNLIQWFNDTIRFETEIPSAFREGYIIIENEFINKDYSRYRKLIRTIAESNNLSFYEVKDLFVDNFLAHVFKTRLYFKFSASNKIYIEVSDCDTNEIMHILNFETGEDSGIEPVITDINADDFINYEYKSMLYDKIVAKFYSAIFATIMWYIATNTSKTKYIYTESRPKYSYDKKHEVDPKNIKMITRTIYDLQKVKTIDVSKLNKRKEGWTYSHSFEVHGHYRHYRNGKVIFIDSYTKGKNKAIKAQKIILNPKGDE